MPRRVRGSIVAITGASSGIGRAAALAFAGEGATIALIARDAETLDEVAEACRAAGGRPLVFPLDVTDAAAVEDCANGIVAQAGRIDVWVNNAAINVYGRLEEVPMADHARVLEVDLVGYFNGARAVIRHMRAQGSGVLVNVSSALGHVAAPFQAAYVASKFGIRGLSDALRQELRDVRGIKVCTILPGPVDTPIFRNAANHTGRKPKALDPPLQSGRVAASIVSAVRWPRREIPVGLSAYLLVASGRLTPRLAEWVNERFVRWNQFTDEAAAPTRGNLDHPVHDEPSGGWEHRRLPARAASAVEAVLSRRSR